jgi:hypothetical protein
MKPLTKIVKKPRHKLDSGRNRQAGHGGIAGPGPLKKLTGFFKNLLQLSGIQEFLVHRMVPCGGDAREPGRDPRPWVRPEGCLAYRGKTAPGGGFAAGLDGPANGASGTAMIFESTGFSPSTAWTLASCGLASVICAPMVRTARGASA